MGFGVFERATGPKWACFDGISDMNAVIDAVLEEVFDLTRLIRQTEDDIDDSTASHQINLIKKKRRIRNRDDRLRRVDRKRTQAGSLATRENEAFHTLSLYQKKDWANALPVL